MAQTEIVLMQAVAKLGVPGDVVRVKAGYFRNFLGPQGMAKYATPQVLSEIAGMRQNLAERHESKLKEAHLLARRLKGISITFERPSRDGHLYGSVRMRDVRERLQKEGYPLPLDAFSRNARIRDSGRHELTVDVYPSVEERITVSVNPEEIADIELVDWIMATPEEQFREIMREEVGDKITNLAEEVRSLTEATQTGFFTLREEMRKQTGELRSEFQEEAQRASSVQNTMKMTQDQMMGSLNLLLEHHGLPTFNGPK